MTERRVILDSAAFLDSPHGQVEGLPTADVRTIAQRFLTSCYEDVGRAPRHLEDHDIHAILVEHLPRRFAARDPLADRTEAVLSAFLAFLAEQEVVFASFEQRNALIAHIDEFRRIVGAGNAHAAGMAKQQGKTVEHRAEKTGRNDPCPCGSGKKFKKCCMRLGS